MFKDDLLSALLRLVPNMKRPRFTDSHFDHQTDPLGGITLDDYPEILYFFMTLKSYGALDHLAEIHLNAMMHDDRTILLSAHMKIGTYWVIAFLFDFSSRKFFCRGSYHWMAQSRTSNPRVDFKFLMSTSELLCFSCHWSHENLLDAYYFHNHAAFKIHELGFDPGSEHV